MRAVGAVLRRWLDRLYLLGGILAALCLITILTLVTLQMLARWTGEVFPGAPDYAGYFMAAASFLAFAYALNYGAHIRVSLLLGALGRYRFIGEIWCFAIGTALSVYFARYAIKTAYWSYRLNDISQGQDATPIWIPRSRGWWTRSGSPRARSAAPVRAFWCTNPWPTCSMPSCARAWASCVSATRWTKASTWARWSIRSS